jgi:hypothetical protein
MSETPEEPGSEPAYRALLLSPEGSVIDMQTLIAADDEEAVQLAKAIVDGHAVDLWDGLRFIEHFDPVGSQG